MISGRKIIPGMIWLGIEFVFGCLIALVVICGIVSFVTACRLAWEERASKTTENRKVGTGPALLMLSVGGLAVLVLSICLLQSWTS